jgi:CDP-diacylglycerol---serine O-phosphatidyltransferase
MKIIKILPSLFTLGNLLCGFLAVINVIEGNLTHAAWWIIIAAVFDTLDGKIARLTGSASEFGVEFDSIVDVVSFGVAPAVLFHNYAFTNAGNLGYFMGFCYLAAGAIRLARFNLKATTGKKYYFTGMPIPAGAGILSAFVLFSEHVWIGISNFDFAVAIVILTSLAMVSNFKYSLMPKISFHSRWDIIRSVWFVSHLSIVVLFPDEAFFPTGIMYLLSGPVRYISVPAFNFVFHRSNR